MAKAAKKAAPKKPKADKKPRKVKAAKPDGKPAAIVAGSNSIDRDMQNLARHHRDKYITAKSALSKAQRGMQALGKLVKADGLTMRQINLMVELMTPEGEAAFRANVAADLVAAQWQGAEIGAQLQLFLEPDRTPGVDQAYEEGVQDSMDGKTAKPGYDPSVPQHARYMEGFHAETERRIKAGIKKPEPEEKKSRSETLAAARAANEVPSPPADKLN